MYASWLAPGRNHLYWAAEGTGVGIIVVLALLLMVFHDSFSDSPLWWWGGGGMPIIANMRLFTVHAVSMLPSAILSFHISVY